jgi:hypothetical protein
MYTNVPKKEETDFRLRLWSERDTDLNYSKAGGDQPGRKNQTEGSQKAVTGA